MHHCFYPAVGIVTSGDVDYETSSFICLICFSTPFKHGTNFCDIPGFFPNIPSHVFYAKIKNVLKNRLIEPTCCLTWWRNVACDLIKLTEQLHFSRTVVAQMKNTLSLNVMSFFFHTEQHKSPTTPPKCEFREQESVRKDSSRGAWCDILAAQNLPWK